MPRPNCPGLTVDAILYRGIKGIPNILLVKRKNEPFGWALPGGFVEVGYTAEQTVVKEVKEETNLDFREGDFVRFKTYSSPDRDPRGHNVSLVYYAYVHEDFEQEAKAGDDAAEVQWFSILQLPDLAFDHKQIIYDFLRAIVF